MSAITHESSWPLAQRDRLAHYLDAQARDPSTTWVGYWCSDAWGRSANNGSTDMIAEPGASQSVKGPLRPCSENALHATREPHHWRGVRVWVVALLGERRDEGEKSAALRREIIGEVMPQDVIDPKIAARMGLIRANLTRADLIRAYLTRANLTRADLSGANLTRANLSDANLSGANLSGANLSGAYLSGANLSDANLSGANLSGAYLSGAYLSGADLSGAYLSGADLSGANRPAWLPVEWIVTADGYIAVRR